MTKKEVHAALKSVKGAANKEKFLSNHNVKFTHDSFNNLIIFCDDGCISLSPVYK